MKTTRFFKTLFLSGILLSLCRCASPGSLLSDPCEGADLFELGRQHGSQGIQWPPPEKASPETFQCVPEANAENEQKYLIGYRSGLSDYCTEENGFNIGSSGLDYLSVCPTLSEREFLKGMQKGLLHRRQQSEVRKLDQKISLLKETLEDKTLAPDIKSEMNEQLAHLVRERKQKIQKVNQ